MTKKSKPNNHLKSGMAGAAAERRLGINFYSRELQARMAHPTLAPESRSQLSSHP
jgi:hypothetical protein